MNDLTFWIYISDIVSNISAFFVICTLISTGIYGVVCIITLIDNDSYHAPEYHKPYPSKWWIVLLITLGLIASIIPSQKTILMMVGSELSEEVITTDVGQEILNELKKTVMYQLQELQK
jgi:hypothetical protein